MTVRLYLLLFALVIVSCTRDSDEDLVHAAAAGDVEKIRLLLAEGANIEAVAIKEWTPLTAAAANGKLEAVKALVNAGAKVDTPAPGGVMAWELAAIRGHDGVVAYLFQAGVDPNGIDVKARQHVLTLVRQKKFKSVEDLLIKYGLQVPPG